MCYFLNIVAPNGHVCHIDLKTHPGIRLSRDHYELVQQRTGYSKQEVEKCLISTIPVDSFGGMLVPDNIAVSDDGNAYVVMPPTLDWMTKRFTFLCQDFQDHQSILHNRMVQNAEAYLRKLESLNRERWLHFLFDAVLVIAILLHFLSEV